MRSLGVNLGLGLYKEILDLYNDMHYLLPNGTTSTETVVTITTDLLCKKGLQNTPEVQSVDGVFIYPKDYFCPLSNLTGKMNITNNTYSIHHYDGTWLPPKQKLAMWIKMHLGERVFNLMCRIQRLVK